MPFFKSLFSFKGAVNHFLQGNPIVQGSLKIIILHKKLKKRKKKKRKTSEAGKIIFPGSDVFENAKFFSLLLIYNFQWGKYFFRKVKIATLKIEIILKKILKIIKIS